MEEKKKCKYCREEIAKDAKKCPVCKKKQGMPTWAIVLIVIVCIIVFCALVSGGSSKEKNSKSTTDSSTSSNTSESTTNSDTKTEDKVYKIGEEVILNNGSIILDKVEKSQGSTYDKPKTGKEFVIVHVTVKNKGTANLAYNPYDFKLQNSNGQQESQTFSTINNDTQLNSGELAANGSVSGTIVFEEPVGDAGLTLIYQNNYWSSKTIQIKL